MILTLECDESSRLLSAGLDRELTWAERAAVAGHQLACKHCRRLRRQLEFLRQAAARREQILIEPVGASPETLSESARERIRAALLRADSGDRS